MVAHFAGVAHLDDFEEGVLHNGNGQAGSDVAHRGAFLLRLLDAGVHEHRAAAAQIDGVRGLVGGGGEFAHGQVQAGGEAFDEGAAAGRAGFVEHDRVEHAVAHLHALHVLAADVQDELDVGQEFLGTAQVGDRFDLARIDAQGFEQEALAVAGHRGVADLHGRRAVFVGRQVGVELADALLGGFEHVAAVVGVVGPQELGVFGDEGHLEGGRTGVDAQEGHSPVGGQVGPLHALLVVALFELAIVVVAGEQGRHAHDFAALQIAQPLEALHDAVQERGFAFLGARERAAGGHEEVGVFGHDDVLFVQAERDVEALAQLGQVLQGAAQKGHVPANGATAGQARDGLRDDGLEDRSGDVLLGGAFVQEGLHVGLGEHAAAARDRVDDLVVAGELVEARSIGVEQGSHLVDEGARAAGALAVHALFDVAVEVDDLGVLAAELDGDVGLGDEGLDRRLVGDDLLDEGNAEPLAEQ